MRAFIQYDVWYLSIKCMERYFLASGWVVIQYEQVSHVANRMTYKKIRSFERRE